MYSVTIFDEKGAAHRQDTSNINCSTVVFIFSSYLMFAFVHNQTRLHPMIRLLIMRRNTSTTRKHNCRHNIERYI